MFQEKFTLNLKLSYKNILIQSYMVSFVTDKLFAYLNKSEMFLVTF